jgi:hypothetical protein
MHGARRKSILDELAQMLKNMPTLQDMAGGNDEVEANTRKVQHEPKVDRNFV